MALRQAARRVLQVGARTSPGLPTLEAPIVERRLTPAAARPIARFRPFSDDSHDDFKPQAKAASDGSIFDEIEREIASHRVVVFMKGFPEQPMCGFSARVCRVLDYHDVDFHGVNVLRDDALREGIKQYSKWPTIPQVYLNGEFIGGCDILMQMHDNDEVEKVFGGEDEPASPS